MIQAANAAGQIAHDSSGTEAVDITTAKADALIEADLVECVLGLGPNLFYNSPMEACVVICRAQKPAERQRHVLFIDAVNEVTRERAQSSLLPEHQAHIVKAYQAPQNQVGFAHVASMDEIVANGYSLSIPRYVKHQNGTISESATDSLADVWHTWEQAGCLFWQEMEDLDDMLDGLLVKGESDG